MLKARVTDPFEDEVRELRDKVYGPQTDNEWEQCKHNWLRPDSVEWLREKAKRVITV
jgi:hypothetical protein